jgi:hypothetical protein
VFFQHLCYCCYYFVIYCWCLWFFMFFIFCYSSLVLFGCVFGVNQAYVIPKSKCHTYFKFWLRMFRFENICQVDIPSWDILSRTWLNNNHNDLKVQVVFGNTSQLFINSKRNRNWNAKYVLLIWKKTKGKNMFIHSKEVFRKGKIKYPSQVIYECDIKRLLNGTSH